MICVSRDVEEIFKEKYEETIDLKKNESFIITNY